MNNTFTPSSSAPRFFFLDKDFLKQNALIFIVFAVLFGLSSGKLSAQCYVNVPSLSSDAGKAIAAFYPTNTYGAVETMWAKNVNGYIYSETSWSTSTPITYAPTQAGYYRMCARRVGCSKIYESYDVYVVPCASIGDLVFDDENLNGIYDDGEKGVEDVHVFLFEVGNPTAIDSDTTGNKGTYLFTQVVPNKSYYLSFSNLPANYQFTANAKGNDDTKDSDVNPATGNTQTVSPSIGENRRDIDAGLVNSLNFPVEWLGFEAKGMAHDALLTWSTATELNASNYIIERSLDGKLFSPVGSVKATGTTLETQHYSFRDKNVNELGTSAISYRLKQADIDGSINYSKSVELDLSGSSSFEMNAYPNPVVNTLTIEWTPIEEIQTLKILNLHGQTVYEQDYQIKTDASKVDLHVSSWSKGTYFLQISTETISETRTFVVQ